MAKKLSTMQQLRESVHCDAISKRRDGSGNYVFRKGYFYSGNQTSEGFSKRISEQLNQLDVKHEIVSHGDHWAAFKGGAPLSQQSHFWVDVKITE